MSEEPRPRSWLRIARVAAATLIVLLSLALPTAWIEQGFSRGVYPLVQATLTPLFAITRAPVMGMALLILPVAIAALAVLRWRHARRQDTARGVIVRRGAWITLRLALYGYASFLLLWGFGYRREPIETRWGLGTAPPAAAQVREVQRRILAVLHRDAGAPRDEGRAMQAILAAELQLVAEFEGWSPTATLPKHPPAGLLLNLGIFGIVSPFTLEANVEPALPAPFRLGVSGHELAHVFGYCGEADANLVVFVAGLRAQDPFARYATAITLLRYTRSRNNQADSRWVEAHLPQRAKDDLAALARAKKAHSIPWLDRLSNRINDAYLKSQGVRRGVGDYSRGYTLFVKAWARGLVDLPPPYEGPR